MYSAVNTIWVLLGAALVFLMQAGFAMCEAGFTRAKNLRLWFRFGDAHIYFRSHRLLHGIGGVGVYVQCRGARHMAYDG